MCKMTGMFYLCVSVANYIKHLHIVGFYSEKKKKETKTNRNWFIYRSGSVPEIFSMVTLIFTHPFILHNLFVRK